MPLVESWETMVISMTHNENIKTFDDLSCHLELEAKHFEASKATEAAKFESAYMVNNDSHASRETKHTNYDTRQDSGNGPAPKKAKNTKHKRGKCGDRTRMKNVSTVTRRDTLLVVALSQEIYSLTLILAKFMFPLMLWLLIHIHIGLLIQGQLNTS